MLELWQALTQFVASFGVLLAAIAKSVLPWLPLIAWIGFWLFAVDWVKLRDTLANKGGWIGVLILAAIAVLIWGLVSPPPGGTYLIFGRSVSTFTEKAVYVAALIMLAHFAGSIQLAGAFRNCCQFETDAPEDDGHGSHGHDGHGDGSHGHDSHGHDSHDSHGGSSGRLIAHASAGHH